MKHTNTSPNEKGILIKKNPPLYAVRTDGEIIHCNLPTRFETDLAVGDEVCLRRRGVNAEIIERGERRNVLMRRAARPKPQGADRPQALAANLDLLVAVLAASSPEPKWNWLDRCLVSAEAYEIPVLICLNKTDLTGEHRREARRDLRDVLDEYRRAGYPVLETSVLTGEGMQELNAALNGKIAALTGQSGTGKSSLLNALQPDLRLRTGGISAANGKGRHTTTGAELFPMPGGGMLMDTPGLREFGLWGFADEDLAHYFPEMRPYLGNCRYGASCRHDEEPGCAVRRAVMDGDVSPYRYRSYIYLSKEATS